MKILVAMLEPIGFFQYLAVLAARSSKGKQFRLFTLLGLITTVLSMFLDNVTTIVLIAPVTLLICEILGVNPIPYLVTEALLSNTGGGATLIGDPPNVLIGSAAGLSFNDFLIYSLPVVFFCWLGAFNLLRYLFKKELSKRLRSVKAVMRLDPAETLNHPETARRILIVLGTALLMFFVHHALHISPSLVALSIVAALSAVVDNIPITVALIPIVRGLGEVGMDTGPLWWALAFGAGFGGSGTIIGSTANILVTSLSEKTRTPNHVRAVAQTRPARDAEHLCSREYSVCAGLSAVLMSINLWYP